MNIGRLILKAAVTFLPRKVFNKARPVWLIDVLTSRRSPRYHLECDAPLSCNRIKQSIAQFVDVEATPAYRSQEVASTQAMVDRVEQRFGLKRHRLLGDTAYGAGATASRNS